MAKTKAEIDKNYEERHKEERKDLVWGTSVSRKFAEEVNAFLKENGYTKVRLIEAGYKYLREHTAKDVEDR